MNARSLVMDRNGVIRSPQGAPPAAATGQKMLILVHGYNNNPAEADESYFSLRQNLDTILASCGIAESARRNFQQNIWELHWPGFLPLSHLSSSGLKRSMGEPAFSSVSYPFEVAKARSWVPDGLSTFLEDSRPTEVFFIGHSLGCRVVLETISRLNELGRVPIYRVPVRGFLLMAGAVPVHLLLSAKALAEKAMTVPYRSCLYSWYDVVLAGAFPPGQIMAGEVPIYGLPVATGLGGAPKSLYTGHAHTRLGHGDYWKGGIFLGVAPYAELLSQAIGIAPHRQLAERAIEHAYQAKKSRALPDRLIGLRLLKGDDWLADRYSPS